MLLDQIEIKILDSLLLKQRFFLDPPLLHHYKKKTLISHDQKSCEMSENPQEIWSHIAFHMKKKIVGKWGVGKIST